MIDVELHKLPDHAPRLVQFAKAPVKGAVKTRMTPHLSHVQALSLHRNLVTHTFLRFVDIERYSLELWVSEQPDHSFFQNLIGGRNVPLFVQNGEHLGERMQHAARQVLQQSSSVILIGSDCPALDGEYVALAERGLREHDAVIGPADDGGYVLLGVKSAPQQLFADVTWGSDQVLEQTRRNMNNLGWQWCELPVLADIDRPEDLSHLPQYGLAY